LTLLSLGEEPDRVSRDDYARLWSGEDYVLREGFGTLVARFGADLPVRLGAPVTAIRWDGPGVVIETPAGTLRAEAALVTVPIGVLTAHSIRFTPDLPPTAQDAISGMRMGAYTKLALRVDRPRLGALRVSDCIDLGADGAMTSYEFWPFGRDLVIAYLGGNQARRICEAGEAAAIAFATERLGVLFGANIRRAITGGRLAAWWTDPFARGSYSIALPGHAAARENLRTPIGERLWMAGEATAGGGAMTAGGAYLEGERAASEILRRLCP
jgi:monoamine oxidase